MTSATPDGVLFGLRLRLIGYGAAIVEGAPVIAWRRTITGVWAPVCATGMKPRAVLYPDGRVIDRKLGARYHDGEAWCTYDADAWREQVLAEVNASPWSLVRDWIETCKRRRRERGAGRGAS